MTIQGPTYVTRRDSNSSQRRPRPRASHYERIPAFGQHAESTFRETLRADVQCMIETRPVVLPGDRGRELHELRVVEVRWSPAPAPCPGAGGQSGTPFGSTMAPALRERLRCEPCHAPFPRDHHDGQHITSRMIAGRKTPGRRLAFGSQGAGEASGVFDDREQLHPPLAAGTGEHVYGEGARQQLRPRAISLQALALAGRVALSGRVRGRGPTKLPTAASPSALPKEMSIASRDARGVPHEFHPDPMGSSEKLMRKRKVLRSVFAGVALLRQM
jgi:hypothetical protein